MGKLQDMNVKVQTAITPKVSWGPTSTLGVLVALVAAAGTIWAGIQGNDTATVTGGLLAGLTALTTLGGRFAQAVASIRHATEVARPFIDVGLDALTDPEAAAVTDDDLPSDREEFESGPEAAEIAVETPPEQPPARPVVDQPQA